MNCRSTLSAVVAVVVLATAGLGEDKYSDASINQTQIVPIVAVATLDVEKVFKKSKKHNAALVPITAEIKRYNYRLPDDHKLTIDLWRVYGETNQRLAEIVNRICKEKDIGLVIQAKMLESEPVDPSDWSSVNQMVNRPVVYSAFPDLTDEVIAELDR